VLKQIPSTITVREAVRIGSGTLTIGEERFAEAEGLQRAGKSAAAAQAFAKLREEFPGTWIDREAARHLAEIK